jgi:hypothetical protein
VDDVEAFVLLVEVEAFELEDEELLLVEVEEEEVFDEVDDEEVFVDETKVLEDEELTTTPPGPATEVVRESLSTYTPLK